MTQLLFIEHELFAILYPKHFTYNSLFNPYNNSME